MPENLSDNTSLAEEAKKSSGNILRVEMKEATSAMQRSAARLFVSGISAGLDIGFSLLMIAVIRSFAADSLPPIILNIMVALAYSFGFIIVILGRSELFTEQTSLAVLPLFSGQATLVQVCRLWGIVYVSNIVGAALFALMAAWSFPQLVAVDARVLETIAKEVVSHSSPAILTSAIFAGWLMGLLSWLVAASRDKLFVARRADG
ncbi:MAG: formate/nitrite transporter family protein, partial [Candidatus Sumerlaeota bacterium]